VLDRAAHRRTDAEWLARALDDADARLVPVWRNRNLVTNERPPKGIYPRAADYRHLLEDAGPPIFLGVDDAGAPHFALDLSAASPDALDLEGSFQDLRMAGAFMPRADFTPLAYARGMTRWHRKTKHCRLCGGALRASEGGFVRECVECAQRVFPRTDPAVMILITHGDRCVLARQPKFPPKMYSALAGFVEHGETLEGCVAREAHEEVGLRVEDVRYVASQPWPFPQSLMVGFRCTPVDADVPLRLDDEELEEARWFTREELRAREGFFYPPPMSLAHDLIRGFLEEHG